MRLRIRIVYIISSPLSCDVQQEQSRRRRGERSGDISCPPRAFGVLGSKVPFIPELPLPYLSSFLHPLLPPYPFIGELKMSGNALIKGNIF